MRGKPGTSTTAVAETVPVSVYEEETRRRGLSKCTETGCRRVNPEVSPSVARSTIERAANFMDAADMLAVLGGLCTVPTRQPPVALRFASPLPPRKAHACHSSRILRENPLTCCIPPNLKGIGRCARMSGRAENQRRKFKIPAADVMRVERGGRRRKKTRGQGR